MSSAIATVREDGTPLFRGRPVRDCRAEMLEKFKRHPNKTLTLNDFRPALTMEQAIWGMERLRDAGEIVRVSSNGHRLNTPDVRIEVAPAIGPTRLKKSGTRGTPTGVGQRVKDAIKAWDGDPMTTAELVALLGDSYTSIQNALLPLMRKGIILRSKRVGANTKKGESSVVYSWPKGKEQPPPAAIEAKGDAAQPDVAAALEARLTEITKLQAPLQVQAQEVREKLGALDVEATAIRNLLKVYRGKE